LPLRGARGPLTRPARHGRLARRARRRGRGDRGRGSWRERVRRDAPPHRPHRGAERPRTRRRGARGARPRDGGAPIAGGSPPTLPRGLPEIAREPGAPPDGGGGGPRLIAVSFDPWWGGLGESRAGFTA